MAFCDFYMYSNCIFSWWVIEIEPFEIFLEYFPTVTLKLFYLPIIFHSLRIFHTRNNRKPSVLLSFLTGNSMLTPAFAPFNQFLPSPPIYSSPPHIFYWTGYGPPSGPISPTYIQPLPIPPHAFHHFSPDRPPTLVSLNTLIL